jgi:hypothetical protein
MSLLALVSAVAIGWILPSWPVALSPATPATSQDPPPPPPSQQQQQPGGRPNGRGTLTPMQVQDIVDGWALVEGERVLQLTDDQRPNFVSRYRTLQRTRRLMHQTRARLMRELQPIIQAPGTQRDEVILEKLRLLDEANVTGLQDVRKAQMDLDAVLTPSQRARFRFFEERLENQKLQLLGVAGRGRGAASPPASVPGRGRGGD